MTHSPAAEEQQAGWRPPAVAHFLCSGRDWGAVRSYFRALAAGDASISQLGLQLLAPQPPPVPTPLAAVPGSASQPVGQPSCRNDEKETRNDAAQDVQAQGTAPLQQHPAAQQQRQGARPHERSTWKICLSYYGPAFTGWQFVKDQEAQSVQGAVQSALQQMLDGRAAAMLAAAAGTGPANGHLGISGSGGGCGSSPAVSQRTVKRLRHPQPVVLATAGRTDRGVHALGQVVSFYTWDDALSPQDVLVAINAAQPGLLRAWHAARALRSFHATFSAQWRRYLYLLPLRSRVTTAGAAGEAAAGSSGEAGSAAVSYPGGRMGAAFAGKVLERLLECEAAAVDAAPDVDPAKVAAMLAQLEGRELDYSVFARDTPAGKDGRCCLLRARAWTAHLPDAQRTPVLAMELVGNRFLRRMVRVLVATAVREAVPHGAVFGSRCGARAAACGGAAALGGQLAAAEVAAGRAAVGAVANGIECLRARPQTEAATAAVAAPAAGLAAGWHEHEAAWDDAGALLRAIAAGDRSQTAPAAPAEGLCFLEAGYGPLPL